MATRYFHWDVVDDCVMHETDGAGATIVQYTHEPGPFGPLVSENRGGVESYHHYDALGSTTLLTDDTGTVTDTFKYDAWGNDAGRTGTTPTPYTWVGRLGYQHDTPTGGYYIRARSYQPTVARWMSVDPLFRLSSLRSFSYCSRNPPNKIDASGLLALSTWSPQAGTNQLRFGIKFGKCGAFQWDTVFKLGPGEDNGIIVQKVCIKDWSPRSCKNAKCTPKQACPPGKNQIEVDGNCPGRCFYEMWDVFYRNIYNEGALSMEDPNVPNPPFVPSPIDTFIYTGCAEECAPDVGCTSGRIEIVGLSFFISYDLLIDRPQFADKLRAEFYGSAEPTSYDPDQYRNRWIKQSCVLPSRCANADLDRLFGQIEQAGSLNHRRIRKSISTQWDCCCREKGKPPCSCTRNADVTFEPSIDDQYFNIIWP